MGRVITIAIIFATALAGSLAYADGDEVHSIPVKNEFAIWINNHLVGDFTKTSTGWKNKDPKAFTNWQFFENFVGSLDSFPVDFHTAIEDVKPNAPSFELREGGRTFLFSKIGERTWGVKLPNAKEFLASRNFSIYGDMDESMWASPFEKYLRVLKDVTLPPEARMSALRNVMTSDSSDVQAVLDGILKNEGDNEELRQAVVQILRQEPTDQNMKVFMAVLKTSKDELLLNQISKALRVRNPQGPVIQLDDEDHEIRRKVAAWQAWGVKLSKAQ